MNFLATHKKLEEKGVFLIYGCKHEKIHQTLGLGVGTDFKSWVGVGVGGLIHLLSIFGAWQILEMLPFAAQQAHLAYPEKSQPIVKNRK